MARQIYAWTAEAVAILKREFARGSSGSVIVQRLPLCDGERPTRSAVCGKLNRMGLLRGALRSTDTVSTAKHNRAPSISNKRVKAPVLLVTAHKTPPRLAMFDKAIPLKQRSKLTDLTATMCHWPVGDPKDKGFFFCGSPITGAGPYCEVHASASRSVQSVHSKARP